MRILRSLVLSCILILVVASTPFTSQKSFAQDATQQSKSALAVSPAIIEQVLKPGEPTNIKLQVTNITKFPLPITTTVRNFIPMEEMLDKSSTTAYDASQWFTPSEPDFILQPEQTKEVPVTINTPIDAEPGGHYATVYFQPLIPKEALTPNTAYMSARVGVLSFLIVPGDTEEKLTLESFEGSSFQQTGPVELTATLANPGGVHLLPNGEVIIRNWRNKELAKLPITTGVILPNTHRKYVFTWDKDWPLGKYTAQATVRYGTENQTLKSATITFWVIPWMLIAAIGLPLIAVLYFIVRTRHRWKRAWHILRGN